MTVPPANSNLKKKLNTNEMTRTIFIKRQGHTDRKCPSAWLFL